ncbi:hypothetical protein LTR17_020966 [Elasticomyces elasticus]|nr:hypothetical protein LTR17_020966 [Elasticomyces elasticus]
MASYILLADKVAKFCDKTYHQAATLTFQEFEGVVATVTALAPPLKKVFYTTDYDPVLRLLSQHAEPMLRHALRIASIKRERANQLSNLIYGSAWNEVIAQLHTLDQSVLAKEIFQTVNNTSHTAFGQAYQEAADIEGEVQQLAFEIWTETGIQTVSW